MKSLKNRKKIFWHSFGFILSTLGLVLIQAYDILEIILAERIRMKPDMPFFTFWKSPPFPLEAKMYIFAVKNSEAFLNGSDTKLHFEEIGPIVYSRYVDHKDVVFHTNSTLSYSTAYRDVFSAEKSPPGIMNQSHVILNPMFMGSIALVNSRFDNYLIRSGLQWIMDGLKDDIFIKRTVYQCLWNFTTPFLNGIKIASKYFMPRDNAGYLYNVFYPNKFKVNVNIGEDHGPDNFFKMNHMNGNTFIPRQEKKNGCPYLIKGATDLSGLPTRLTEDSVLQAFVPQMCSTFPLVTEARRQSQGLDCLEFRLQKDYYDRTNGQYRNCLKVTNHVQLPDGLADFSKCTFGLPIALSNPHFSGFENGPWERYIQGLKPNRSLHETMLLIEPTLGFPVEGAGRVQVNLVMPKIKETKSDSFHRFSEMVIPVFWVEYSFKLEKTMYVSFIKVVLYHMSVIKPVVQCLCLIGSFYFILSIRREFKKHRQFLCQLELMELT